MAVDVPNVTDVDQPAWLMSRVAPPMLVIGGLLSLGSFLVPGYLRPELLPRVQMAGTGVGALVMALLLYRIVVRPGWIFGVALGADAGIVTTSLALLHPQDMRLVSVTFAISTVLVALFVTIRVYLVKVAVIAAGAATMMALSGESAALLTLHTVLITFGVVAPGFLVLGLRSSLEQALERQRRMAATDPLTGLANRRGLVGGLPGLSPWGADPVLGVVVLDLDHFKAVNDQHGHLVGDQVICTVADAVRLTVRQGDVVARLGGEELAVVSVLDPAGLSDLAERIRRAVQTAGTPWGVTVSVGVAWTPWTGHSEQDLTEQVWSLVDRADDLMYEAKRTGRNRVVVLPEPGERVSVSRTV